VSLQAEDSNIRLREYRREDLHAIFKLDEACFGLPFRFTLAAMRNFAESRRALTVVAEREDAIVGFCIAHVERGLRRSVGYVVTLDVSADARRQGLARRMLKTIEEQAREKRCDEMALHVSIENASAIAFYERARYVRSHTAEGFYGRGLDAFVYRKPLV
jgi:ribosomal-protein-alanine N-acetyltransferase